VVGVSKAPSGVYGVTAFSQETEEIVHIREETISEVATLLGARRTSTHTYLYTNTHAYACLCLEVSQVRQLVPL
jgi:hypothetical protein